MYYSKKQLFWKGRISKSTTRMHSQCAETDGNNTARTPTKDPSSSQTPEPADPRMSRLHRNAAIGFGVKGLTTIKDCRFDSCLQKVQPYRETPEAELATCLSAVRSIHCIFGAHLTTAAVLRKVHLTIRYAIRPGRGSKMGSSGPPKSVHVALRGQELPGLKRVQACKELKAIYTQDPRQHHGEVT